VASKHTCIVGCSNFICPRFEATPTPTLSCRYSLWRLCRLKKRHVSPDPVGICPITFKTTRRLVQSASAGVSPSQLFRRKLQGREQPSGLVYGINNAWGYLQHVTIPLASG